jgi:hypothetical protein
MLKEKLDETHEKLLVMYFDNELGLLGRWRARCLIKNSSSAASFYSSLEEIRNIAFSDTSREPPLFKSLPAIDLWGRINKRIESEMKSEVLLGKRSLVARSSELKSFILHLKEDGVVSKISSLFKLEGLLYGSAGAAVATLLILFVYSPLNNDPLNSRMSKVDPIINEISFQREQPRSALIEVDWMKSDGRLNLIQSQNGGHPVIWIARKKQSSYEKRREDALKNKQLKDNRIIVYKERIPEAISVVDSFERESFERESVGK